MYECKNIKIDNIELIKLYIPTLDQMNTERVMNFYYIIVTSLQHKTIICTFFDYLELKAYISSSQQTSKKLILTRKEIVCAETEMQYTSGTERCWIKEKDKKYKM